MVIIDISNPLILLLITLGTALLIFLAQENKKSYVTAMPLFAFLIVLVIHVIELMIMPKEQSDVMTTVLKCIVIDFVFILITFFAYLWVDDMEAKKTGKKSLDNSLDWFWKKV